MLDATHENDPDKVRAIVNNVRIAMFVTRTRHIFEERPLSAFPEPEAGRILFMTDAQHLLDEVAANPGILLSFADPDGNDFAAIDVDAVVRNDRAKVEELWNPWAEAFSDSPDDQAIRVIQVTAQRARCWDAPNKLAPPIATLAGALTGQPPSSASQAMWK
jgi:general stress protein 26